MTYRSELDGVRALAVVLVLIFHFALIPVISGGFIGVDVFFVLSGYLITGITVPQIREGRFDLKDFYIRRVRRLMPALYAVCFATLAFGFVYLFPSQLAELAKQTAAAAFQVSNIYYWRFLDYFGFGAGETLLLHSWSLGVEAQFYLAYPLALLTVARFAPQRLGAAIGLILLVSLALNLFMVGYKPEATFYLTPTRVWELCAGGLLALLPRVEGKSGQLLTACGLALIVTAAVVIDKSRAFPGAWALLPVLGTMAVIAGPSSGPAASFLKTPPLRYLGQISYSLYLVHWPIAVAANMIVPGGPGLAGRAGLTLLSVLAADLLYRFVETPFRKPGKARLRVGPRSGYAAVLGTLTLFVGVGFLTQGLPQRFGPQSLAFLEAESDRFVARRACRGISSDPVCLLGEPGGEPSVLLWGDSHALASSGAFDVVLDAQGKTGILSFSHACPPIFEVSPQRSGSCIAEKSALLRAVESDQAIGTVVLASIWRLFDHDYYGPDGQLLSFEAREQALMATLSALRAAGKEVVVMLPVPVHDNHVPRALARQAPTGRAYDSGTTLADYRSSHARLLALLENEDELTLLRPAPLLCTPVCRVERDGRSLYADNNHLSRTGATYLGELWLEEDAAAFASVASASGTVPGQR
jgi:peptidoglycan/LPS O-acetylase OafA/YrhL